MSKNIDKKNMINKYINEVQSELPFSCPGRHKFIINLKQELQDISTDNKIYDYTTLCELVGSPLTVCDNYISSISSKIKRNKIFSVVIIIFLLILLIGGIVFIQNYYNNHPKEKGYLRVITIESEEEIVEGDKNEL